MIRMLLTSTAAGMFLLASVAVAQDKPAPDAGKKDPAPAAAPQKAPEKNADKPRTDDAKKPNDPAGGKQPEKPAEKQADKPAEKQADKPADKNAPSDRKDRPNSDTPTDRNRSTDKPTDRSTPDNSRDAQRSTDRSNRETNDKQRGGEQGKKGEAKFSASDLGFSFSDQSSDEGLKISKTSSNTLATKAKFREGDIVVSINDNRVRSQRDFVHYIHVAPRERISIIVLRDDREVTLYLEPELIQEYVVTSSGAWLGVDLYDKFSRAAVVLKVHTSSPAERAGLRGDDLIVAVDGEDIRSPEHLGEVIGGMQPGAKVAILVERNRREQTIDATLGRRQSVATRTEVRR